METNAFDRWMETAWEDHKYGPSGPRDAVVCFLTELRRTIAGDGPHCRPPGALEAFDKACNALGVPFLEP